MEISIGMGKISITYENGYILSILNGFGSYSENHFNLDRYKEIIEKKEIFAKWTSKDVEIAVINKQGDFVTNEALKGIEGLEFSNEKVITVEVEKLIEIMNYLIEKK